MDSKNIKYIVLTIILLILSVFGVFLIFKINSSPLSLFLSTSETTPTDTQVSEEIVPTSAPTIEITPEAVTGKLALPSPTKKPTITPSPTATPTAKITPTAIPTITGTQPKQSTFNSTEDSFSVSYSPTRKLYQDKESTGNRYTFYLAAVNFAIHVSPSGTWSWTNSARNFTSTFTVAGKNTFRYDIATQTIVDLQSSTKNYTLQCVHNGSDSLKAECETFLKSFQLQ